MIRIKSSIYLHTLTTRDNIINRFFLLNFATELKTFYIALKMTLEPLLKIKTLSIYHQLGVRVALEIGKGVKRLVYVFTAINFQMY